MPIDFEAAYEHAPCGYLIIGDDGLISAVNETFLQWTGHTRQALLGTSLSRLLPVGDRILYSTHVAPQLRVNGSVAEVVLEIVAADASRRPALLSASRTAGSATAPAQTRVIIFGAAQRRRYEQELIAALQRAHESDALHLNAQAAAESTQEFQDAVFAATPDTIAVWEVDTATLLWANRSMPDQLGYRNHQAAAMATDLGGHLVSAQDLDKFTAALAVTCAAADREVAEVEFRMDGTDGTTRWFSRRTTPLRRDKDRRVTQVVGITREITAEKTAANDLRESEGLFRQLADSVDVAFFLHRGDPPQFLYASPGFVKTYGYDPMVTGKTPVQVPLIHPEDRERFQRDYWIPLHQGHPAQIDYRLVLPDGQTRWIRSITAPVVRAESDERHYSTTSEDITTSRQAEAALLQAEAAGRANAAKNDFLSRMSHELRTPLNAVLGFAQLLELDPLTGDQQSGVQHILRGGRHLLGLIDDVLEISKIESNHLDISLEPVSVATLLSETMELMTPQALSSEVTLRFEPTTVARCYVHADERRLRQVLINLLSNAVKYNRRGGRVAVRCRRSGSESGSDAHLYVDVTDTGSGIRRQDLPRLFTPFDRLGAESTGIEGSGVGLALSLRLMTLMGGTLTATSEIGVGSTFTLSLPLMGQQGERPDAAAVEPAADSSPPEESPRARTVLYIEDNSSNVELMEQLISRRPGWRMLVAGNGQLGVELASTEAPDLVLLDLHLPDTGGMDVLVTLRADPATRHVQIVVLSADANQHQQQRLRDAGADAYLTKPIDVAQVLGLLDRPRPSSP